MATNKKIGKDDVSVSLSDAAKERLKSLSTNSKTILKTQYGIEAGLVNLNKKTDKLSADLQKIVRKSFSSFVGEDSTLNDGEMNTLIHLASQRDKITKTATKDKLQSIEEFKKAVSEKNSSQVSDIINTRRMSKTQLYASYDLILQIIPKMKLGLNTIVTSIISPDDFTKNSLNTIFDTNTLDDAEIENIRESLASLLETHNINKNLKPDIEEFLVKGELFFSTLSINDELKRLLKENTTVPRGGYKTLNEGCFFNLATLNESVSTTIFNEDLEFFNTAKTLFAESKLSDTALVENLNCLLKESIVTGNSKTFFSSDNKKVEELEAYMNTNKQSTISEDNDLVMTDDGAILKKLNPANVVKLEYDGKCYGYVYLDTIDEPTNKTTQMDITKASPMGTVIYSGNDFSSDGNSSLGSTTAVVDPKLMLIANMFTNKLAKSENLALLKNNENLKNAIYYSLKTKDILRKDKLRITYFLPEEVTHIDRGCSIFDNILFFAKMYIATLITILMQNIVRGGDRRAYYIEVGMENDISAAVNSAIRDIKSKDIVGIQNYDIQQILQVVGEFNDYYLPQIDGEKPITFDTVSGLSNDSLDNDFLNWLSNNIFSGIGLPSAFLTEVENIDFAKTLSMQNSRFIRDIVADQAILGLGYSTILQRLFKLKFTSSTTDKAIAKSKKKEGKANVNATDETVKELVGDKKEDKDISAKAELNNEVNKYDTIDVKSIKVLFPSPMSLNMTNLNDQISNFSSFLDPILETIEWEEADKEKANQRIKHEFLKKYVTGVDWAELDDIITKTRRGLTKDKLKKTATTPPVEGEDPLAVDPLAEE